jgi:hypothetical protein
MHPPAVQVRSKSDAELLYEAKYGRRDASGKMSREQYAALRRRVGGTAKGELRGGGGLRASGWGQRLLCSGFCLGWSPAPQPELACKLCGPRGRQPQQPARAAALEYERHASALHDPPPPLLTHPPPPTPSINHSTYTHMHTPPSGTLGAPLQTTGRTGWM